MFNFFIRPNAYYPPTNAKYRKSTDSPDFSKNAEYAYAIANQNRARPKFQSTLYKSGSSPTQNLGQVSLGRAQVFCVHTSMGQAQVFETWAEPGLVCVVWTRLIRNLHVVCGKIEELSGTDH